MKILTKGNAKIVKGEKLGYLTQGIHFSPADKSGYEVCRWRSKGCSMVCLDTAGRGAMDNTQQARIAKTKWFFEDRDEFMEQLVKELGNGIRLAKRKEMLACFRPNLTSDVVWEQIEDGEGKTVLEHYPDTQFYDYTKSFDRMKAFVSGELPSNYHLTFSRSEHNDGACHRVLAMGGSVAVVFRNRLPLSWKDCDVVDGDVNDLRFLDKQGVVVGLIEKGLAKKDESGFVQEV